MVTQDPNTNRLLIGVALILLIYIVSVPFYIYFEKFTPIQAAYFVTTSITSVGYGDIAPKTDIGRVYTIFLLLAGVTIFFYHVTHFGLFKERTIDPHVQKRLQMLRNLTMLQTGDVKKEQIKRIKERIEEERREKAQEFGKL